MTLRRPCVYGAVMRSFDVPPITMPLEPLKSELSTEIVAMSLVTVSPLIAMFFVIRVDNTLIFVAVMRVPAIVDPVNPWQEIAPWQEILFILERLEYSKLMLEVAKPALLVTTYVFDETEIVVLDDVPRYLKNTILLKPVLETLDVESVGCKFMSGPAPSWAPAPPALPSAAGGTARMPRCGPWDDPAVLVQWSRTTAVWPPMLTASLRS